MNRSLGLCMLLIAGAGCLSGALQCALFYVDNRERLVVEVLEITDDASVTPATAPPRALRAEGNVRELGGELGS